VIVHYNILVHNLPCILIPNCIKCALFLPQSTGHYGLDYFMVKVNVDLLQNSVGQINPINLNNAVDSSNDDLVFVVQYPGGNSQCFAFSVCYYIDSKSITL